jgi:hypothetical protein
MLVAAWECVSEGRTVDGRVSSLNRAPVGVSPETRDQWVECLLDLRKGLSLDGLPQLDRVEFVRPFRKCDDLMKDDGLGLRHDQRYSTVWLPMRFHDLIVADSPPTAA